MLLYKRCSMWLQSSLGEGTIILMWLSAFLHYLFVLGWVKSFAILYSLLKLFTLWNIAAGVGSSMVIGTLTCALLHCMCNLKATQMNVQCRLIWALILVKFKMDHNVAEATRNISCGKGEDTFDYSKGILQG